MKISQINFCHHQSFKRIISKDFIKYVQEEANDYAQNNDIDKKNELYTLWNEVEDKTKLFDIEVLPPKVEVKDDNVEEIIPNVTVVSIKSLMVPLIYKLRKNYENITAGTTVYEENMPPMLPFKELKYWNGWSTGLGYITQKRKYPPAKEVLTNILTNVKYAERELKKDTFY